MKGKIKIYAGVFLVVALFLATTVTVNAGDPGPMGHKIPGVLVDRYIYVEEEPVFPDELPFGTSSLTVITRVRVIDIWHGIAYDVGFTVWVMKLRDGPFHFWDFDGQIDVVYREGNELSIINKDLYDSWEGYFFPGFRIERAARVIIEDNFYTAHVTATITKDLGPPEYEDVDLEGFYYKIGDMLTELEQAQTLPLQ